MVVLYRFFVRALFTRGRVLALGALGTLAVVLGFAVGRSDVAEPTRAGFRLVSTYGLAGLAPIASLVFASAAFGDLVEDQTLVHVWLRPISRARIAFAALSAVLTVTLPLVVLPLTISAAITGADGGLAIGTAVASALAVMAYSSVFLWLGLRVSRALVWGLVYILIWEGAVANVGAGLARFAVRLYTRSFVASFTEGVVEVKFGVVRAVALAVPVGLTLVGFALTSRRLARTDVS